VTFLFTDIESSTRLWEERPDEMRAFVAEHDARFRAVIEANAGYVVKGRGDGVHAAFGRAADAIAAAEQCQAAMADLPDLKVRMGLNTGEVEERDGDYFGPPLNRAARLMDAGHGGQVLLAGVTADLVPNVVMRNLGEHRLRDLGGPMVVWQLGTDDFPPLRTLDELPGNLPVQVTSFVGRADEVDTVTKLVEAHRLVTLTGVGGVGKTRLATQAAAELADRFTHGVWLVELASIDASRVIGTIARELSVDMRPGTSLEESLIEAVSARELLLLLDNCEHVVREVRRVANELLRSTRGVSILATSREGLRVEGEQLFTVPSLDDDASGRLFVERARESDSAFAPDAAGAVVITNLCRRLDGVPLAIELAAARARMFSVAELARRVEQRFRLLTGGRGDVERHQTLRAAIDWSYDLLEPAERIALARMSVFAGGGTLAAAEAVVADDDTPADLVIDIVASLVDKSLVFADRSHAESRYEMLETIRQYAQERLVESGEPEVVRARHARWYADFARRAGRGLYSADELMWDERLRPEVDNLQVAVGWAAGAGDTDTAMRIGGSFPRGAVARPLLGTAHLAEVALQVERADTHSAYTRVLAEAGWAAVTRGDNAGALQLLTRSLDAQRAGGRFAVATFTYLLTGAWSGATWEERLEFAREGLALAEASGDRLAEIGMRTVYASTLSMADWPAEALAQAQRALDGARTLRQPTLEAAALFACAQAEFGSNPGGALERLREALDLARRHHTEAEEGSILGLIAFVEARHGDAREALEAIRERALWELRNPSTTMSTYYLGSGAFSRVGRPDLVALCEGNSRSNFDSYALTTLWVKLHNEEIGEARTALGDERFDELVARGAATPAEEFHPMLVAEIDALLESMPTETDRTTSASRSTE
jgi:predicted ATPase